jgi:hypothetical protein
MMLAALIHESKNLPVGVPTKPLFSNRYLSPIEDNGVGAAGLTRPASQHYSITSSARARIDGGTVRPSAFAVLRLMTSSIFSDC